MDDELRDRVARLTREARAAEEVVLALENKQYRAGANALRVARAEFDVPITEAQNVRAAAYSALDAVRVEVAKAGLGLPAPLGTVFVEARSSSWGGGGMRPTGKRAVLEVLDAGSEWQRAGDRCRVGDVVLRLLKVDGTPGRRVLKLHADRLPFGWRSKEEMPRA